MQSRTPRRPEKSSKLTQQRNNTCWQLSIRTEASPDCASGNEVARPPRNGRASNTWTRNPAPPRAAAAESPANPPPITITLGIFHHTAIPVRQVFAFGTFCRAGDQARHAVLLYATDNARLNYVRQLAW